MDNYNLKSVFPPVLIDNETVVDSKFMQLFIDAINKNKSGVTQANNDIAFTSDVLATVKEQFEEHITNHPSGGTNYVHPETHPASMITGLSTVATSGSYNDLANKPTIPIVDVTKSYVDGELAKKSNTTHTHTDKVDKSVYDAKVLELTNKNTALENRLRLLEEYIESTKPKEQIYYGRLKVSEVGGGITQYSNITANMIKNSPNLTISEPKTFGKTSLGLEAETAMGDHIVILVPKSKNYTVTKDNGFGGKVPFNEDEAGANGIILNIDGIDYKLYGEMLNDPAQIFFYID